ncbi:MAG: hypothetical protein ACOCP8_00265 [archaeon]
MNLKYFNVKQKTEKKIIIESKHKKIILKKWYDDYQVTIINKVKANNRRNYIIENNNTKCLPNKYIEMIEHCMLTLKLSQN